LLAAFCVLVWQGGRSAYMLNLFEGLSRSGFSSLRELWAVASGANLWIIVLGASGLGTLALLAGFVIFLLRDEG